MHPSGIVSAFTTGSPTSPPPPFNFSSALDWPRVTGPPVLWGPAARLLSHSPIFPGFPPFSNLPSSPPHTLTPPSSTDLRPLSPNLLFFRCLAFSGLPEQKFGLGQILLFIFFLQTYLALWVKVPHNSSCVIPPYPSPLLRFLVPSLPRILLIKSKSSM